MIFSIAVNIEMTRSTNCYNSRRIIVSSTLLIAANEALQAAEGVPCQTPAPQVAGLYCFGLVGFKGHLTEYYI